MKVEDVGAVGARGQLRGGSWDAWRGAERQGCKDGEGWQGCCCVMLNWESGLCPEIRGRREHNVPDARILLLGLSLQCTQDLLAAVLTMRVEMELLGTA